MASNVIPPADIVLSLINHPPIVPLFAVILPDTSKFVPSNCKYCAPVPTLNLP